ncbi:MAG: late competence development ComFB family protein [Treponema sp.]|jgi:competence protein ComFB|nr:late competence development ComFB family protein [Treponema sp.]
MRLHNINEDIVLSEVTNIFNSIEADGNPENICTCAQCRMDTACYVLNRIEPHYIISNRGVVRIGQGSIERQQKKVDIITIIHEGIKQINKNRRTVSHGFHAGSSINMDRPVFNIPTIVGRLFNGINFTPIEDIEVELRRNGDIVTMIDSNWQNPYQLSSHCEGTFSFWPAPIQAEYININRDFEFLVKTKMSGFGELNHFFKIPVTSEIRDINAFSSERTFKLSDLYIFPLGESEFQ